MLVTGSNDGKQCLQTEKYKTSRVLKRERVKGSSSCLKFKPK